MSILRIFQAILLIFSGCICLAISISVILTLSLQISVSYYSPIIVELGLPIISNVQNFHVVMILIALGTGVAGISSFINFLTLTAPLAKKLEKLVNGILEKRK